MPIIELTKANEKGEKVKYFTDSAYFNQKDLNHLDQVLHGAFKFRTTASVIVGLASYHLFNYVPAAKSVVSTKFTHKSAGSLLALGVAGITYLLSSFIVQQRYNSQSNRIISTNSHPGWWSKDRVVNPERVFFQLDDARNNQINIIHSGLSLQNAQRLYPDFIVGSIPSKPHAPVAEHHH